MSIVSTLFLSSDMWKTNDTAGTAFGIFRRSIFKRKCLGKFSNSFLADDVLYMKIVLSHIHICVANDALNHREIHTQGLHH